MYLETLNLMHASDAIPDREVLLEKFQYLSQRVSFNKPATLIYHKMLNLIHTTYAFSAIKLRNLNKQASLCILLPRPWHLTYNLQS